MALVSASPSANADDLALLTDSVADYCARALSPRRLRDLRSQRESFDSAVWREMADLGWTSLGVPEARGGVDLGAAAITAVCRNLGRVVAGEPFIESALASASLLAALDSNDARLAPLLAGERVYSCPLRASAWRDFAQVEAVRDGANYRLSGEIAQLPIAVSANAFLLPTRLDHRLAVFVVPRDTPGLNVTAVELADSTSDGKLRFEAVTLAGDELLGFSDEHDGLVQRLLSVSGLGGGAYLLGLAEALLDMTLDYVRTRQQFGRAIGSFQALQHRLVDLYLQVRLSGAALHTATLAYDDGHASLAISRMRQRCSETALTVAREAVQMHGAIGYTEQSDVALYVQRVLVMAARFGGALEELAAGSDDGIVANIVDDSLAPDVGAATAAMPAGSDWNVLPDDDFRAGVRHWVAANYAPALRHYPGQIRWADVQHWHAQLLERGWAAPAWPLAHGGMGLAPAKMLIFIEELERHGVARAPDQGILMVGPILMEYGSDEQRARFMRLALTGEHIWCQGYSEPNAGSDLASLTTRAVIDGDEFVVSGQKTWTSHAQDATHMFCLVRTDANVKPQAGISFLLIDLDQPGVVVRPIPNLSGDVDFCEVFLDDVRVPRANLVGQLNAGWTIAKALLGHERLFVGSPKLCQHALNQLRELSTATGVINDAVFHSALTAITLDVLDLEALYSEFAAVIKAGGTLGGDVAILKIWATETYVRLSEMIVKVAGEAGGVRGKNDFGGTTIDVLSHYYAARPAPIYAGSNEIQRNIVAKHVLDLPS